MATSLKKTTVNGMLWSMTERFSSQLVGFVVLIIMSRMLSDTDYGLVGMLTIFIDLSQNLVDCGVSQALIRKQNRTQKDCSTAFIFNVVLSLALYGVLYVVSPYIAAFYHQPTLTCLTRVISLSIVINALVMVQRALLNDHIDFKTQTKASLAGAVIAGVSGILMAYYGFGVWAIVYYQLLNLAIVSAALWMMSRWRPTLDFSTESFKYFFRFGSNLTVAGIMQTIYRDMYFVVIGKFYSASMLGLYTRAFQLGAFPSGNVNAILQRVTYPVMCRFQNSDEELGAVFKKFIRMIAFAVFPLMIGMAILSGPLVNVLLGDKWAYCGQLLSVLCLSMMWIPVDTMNLNLLQVKGRTDYFLKCEIIKKIFGVAILVATIPMGLMMMCWGQVVRAIIDMIIDCYYTGLYYKLGFMRQMRELLPTILYSLVMALMVYVSVMYIQSDILKLGVGIVVAMFVYVGMAFVTGSRELREYVSLIKK